jgi:hypothetical protein
MSSGLGMLVEERLNVRLMTGIVAVGQMSHNCFIDQVALSSLRRGMHVNDSGESGCGVKCSLSEAKLWRSGEPSSLGIDFCNGLGTFNPANARSCSQ